MDYNAIFFTLMFMLLGCLSLYAADNDLTTKQITITLEKAGTLPDRIASSKKNKITNLKIIGEINGTDLRMIREMAGSNSNGNSTDGKLSVLDLSEAKIVKGGDCYLNNGYDYTSNDVIGSRAFLGCSGLTSLTLPAGITSIATGVFSSCSGLTSLTLPADITSIGDEAFQGCSGLTSIYVYAEKVPKIDSNAFKGVDAKKCTLYVPMGTRYDYCASDFGDYFENIVEFEATGIDKTTTSTDVEEVVRYSVNGQRLSAPTKGLNIVKYSDGSVKKVAVR
ncbi:leucine-rich repeat domain-containing protein [Prevotella sp.]|uniref:leucine-rich repeat domain-containing protein n=2 Tax=Prevotellaceae TaxID=171552 RepID=UPI00307BD87B